MVNSGFMHKYYDWSAFELFVKELYEDDGDVTILRDVTEQDRYGAKRQTDVKIVRRTRFHTFTTLVECKRWKDPVSRDRIDVLAASIEALGAQNGAIFTTTGFEEGAIAYAKGKKIELFVVRDLTPQEWGLPGRHITLHLHVCAAEFKNIQFSATGIHLIDTQPGQLNLNIELNPNKAFDPNFDLFSVNTGENGPNLINVLADTHSLLLSTFSNGTNLIENGRSMTLEIDAFCELDFSSSEFIQLRLPEAAVRIQKIGFEFRSHISQSTINIDRGENLDFAVMIENFASAQRLLAQRGLGEPSTIFTDAPLENSTPPYDPDDVFQNGSIARVICSPWVGLTPVVPDRRRRASQLIKIRVKNEARKARLDILT